MSKDVYEYEEEQEKLAMNKSLFLPMKQWYSANIDYFKDRYEDFPSFWQDLDKWNSFKIIKKIYLVVMEKKEANEDVDLSRVEHAILNPLSNVTLRDTLQSSDNTAECVVDLEEKKKKRRSKWGSSEEVVNGGIGSSEVSEGGPESIEDANKKARRSRWSAVEAPPPPPPPLASLPIPSIAATSLGVTQEVLQQTLILQMQLKQINDKLLTVIGDAKVKELDPNRSPSPPPKYDTNGKRVNTREVRMRESLTAHRIRIIEEMIRVNPLFQPPPDFVKSKPYRKLYIPYKEYPQYNFIGLIIGPRGNTQKRMEKDSNTKISIRGKGSIKEGSKGRAAKNPDEDDELHVHIAGETEENVALAAKLVAELLVPVDDEKNEHKQKQLRELALINGTLREDEFCTVCGEKGHRHFECPQRTKSFQAAGVKCSICGDQSHPARDCPLKEKGPTNQVTLDSEYMNFMAELGDEVAPLQATTNSETAASTVSTSVSGGGTASVTVTETTGKKQQTVIHVKSLLTGSSMPPLNGASGYTMPPGIDPYQQYQQYGAAYNPQMGMQMWGAPVMPQMYADPNYAQWAYANAMQYPYAPAAQPQIPLVQPGVAPPPLPTQHSATGPPGAPYPYYPAGSGDTDMAPRMPLINGGGRSR